jgi:hypothetical protein
MSFSGVRRKTPAPVFRLAIFSLNLTDVLDHAGKILQEELPDRELQGTLAQTALPVAGLQRAIPDVAKADGDDMDRGELFVLHVIRRQHRRICEEPDEIEIVGGGLELENETSRRQTGTGGRDTLSPCRVRSVQS